MRPPPLIEIHNLSVRLGQTTILEDVSFDVQAGHLHALIGPNGAGKTTLIRCLLGGMPHRGTIRYRFRATATIGYVPQLLEFDHAIPMTVEDFVASIMQRRAVPLGVAKANRVRIRELLADTGCEHLTQRRMGSLSGGEFQRVMLAQALYPEPEILILDEPASNVDEAGRQHFDALLCELRARQGVSIVMVGHHLGSILPLADRVSVLNRRLLACGPVEELRHTSILEQVFGITAFEPVAAAKPAGTAGRGA